MNFRIFAGMVIPALVLNSPALSATRTDPASGAMQLYVDATEAPRGIAHARVEIPVKPGALTLCYPKWIQGEHAPSGPITDLAGLRLTAAGRAVPWQRDPVDMYAFHCTVPPGAQRLEVAFDALQSSLSLMSSGGMSTSQLAMFNWNQLILYPKATSTTGLTVAAHLRLPSGWQYGTALETASETSGEINFAPVSLYTLVDSPLLAGAYHRRIDLSPGKTPAHAIDILCDSDAGLAASPATVAAWRQLVNEGGALFGARHYRRYDFLLALSDDIAHMGLEHHESSDDRLGERALVDEQLRKGTASLLPHEYVHSWVGKYRRPAGLATPDYQVPLQTDMLWVYEGLTQYLGFVLTARSGLVTPEWQRDVLAYKAGSLDREPGRVWRPLEDTATGAQFLYYAPTAWASWRRGVDFYDEGLLIWLEADVLIRQKTHATRSLDDFCKLFAGGVSGSPRVVPHSFGDVVSTLNRVTPYDWRGFFRARLDSTTTRAPLAGITAGGWRLAWGDSIGDAQAAGEKAWNQVDETFSLGILMDKDGVVTDVLRDSPAARAGLAPGMKPISVAGRRFSIERLRQELRASTITATPLELIASQGDFVRAFQLDWHGGPLYPKLVRDASMPDLLSEIFAPRTPPVEVESSEGR